jgi:hypothetical protein
LCSYFPKKQTETGQRRTPKKDVKVTPYLNRAENEKKIETLWFLRRIKERKGKFHSISKLFC